MNKKKHNRPYSKDVLNNIELTLIFNKTKATKQNYVNYNSSFRS
ncbi:hypothetical protein SAMN05444274_104264 [Mariniphaga anaerophila]|uniref:Transposase n=1 Tax=Mariniphaga anaerophila TaxID=1484053 RepID=A0A1M5ABC9_9BACT|nr:hypothetical protein SAMN05444274_104264 [Mariniphaga anaerophila]